MFFHDSQDIQAVIDRIRERLADYDKVPFLSAPEREDRAYLRGYAQTLEIALREGWHGKP